MRVGDQDPVGVVDLVRMQRDWHQPLKVFGLALPDGIGQVGVDVDDRAVEVEAKADLAERPDAYLWCCAGHLGSIG